MKGFLKYILSGILLLFLFHFETIDIGPVKISHLWKGILLLFLIISLQKRKRKGAFIYKPLLFLSFLQLINFELLVNPFNAVLFFGTTLIMPLLGVFLLKYPINYLKSALLFFASFFVLCFVPYELGLLESYGATYELTAYGDDQSGIIGPFQGPHAASTALAGAFLVILYFWFTKAFNRIYLSLLIILCFYFLIFTYVRTGMLMVVIGVMPILIFFAKEKASTRLRLVVIGALFSVLMSGWVLSNETVMDRITGTRKHSSETDSFEKLGSGRGIMYLYAVEIFVESNIFEKIFGIGQTMQKQRMKSKLGAGLVPHNGFLLLLLNNGIIGLLAFLLFLRKIIFIIKNITYKERVLIRSLLYAYLVMTFFQSYDLLYMYFILVLGITYCTKRDSVLVVKN